MAFKPKKLINRSEAENVVICSHVIIFYIVLFCLALLHLSTMSDFNALDTM